MRTIVVWAILLLLPSRIQSAEKISEHLFFSGGPVNSVILERDGAGLAVYGPAEDAGRTIELVLVTHHRRDVVWAARASKERLAAIIAPEKERALIENPGEFWKAFAKGRFHDYDQQSTKILAEPLPVSRWVKEGDAVEWRGTEFRVFDTPGYTRGGVSYIAEIDGSKIAFTGDLVYGDGKILDLYSFQDAIPEAKIRGYHGYGSRLAALVSSLERIAAEKPDLIIPARGPIIREPGAAITRLIQRVRALYKNYLSTNALHWYFKEDRMRASGERILGKGAEIELMPYSIHQKTPDWVFEHATSRLLISDDGSGFLLDCGYQRVIDAVKRLMAMGLVQKVEGIFVTHYHDDHSDRVQAAAEEFKCPVYATPEYADVLENPGAYHLPAMTANPISGIQVKQDGERMKWHEFDLTFYFYPGQAYYHGALLVKRGGEKPVFFIGDSFAPSGIDDYCVLNRNLVHENSGYQLCFQKLRQLDEDVWLVNEHIPYVFAFSDRELNYLETRYRQRVDVLRELFPWDDPNYGIDEQWAFFYPYGIDVSAGNEMELEIRISNHSPVRRTFHVTPRPAKSMRLLEHGDSVTLESRSSGKVRFRLRSPEKPGTYLVTADVRSEGMDFRDWIEALVTVK